MAAFVTASLKEFGSFGISAQAFKKNEGDRLFSYFVSFSIINEKVAIELNGNNLTAIFRGGSSQRDAELILQLLQKAHKCMTGPIEWQHSITVFCHAQFAAENGMDSFFNTFSASRGLQITTIGGYDSTPTQALLNRSERLDINIVPSELFPNAVFVTWNLPVTKGAFKAEDITAQLPRLKALAESLGLEVS